MNKNLKNKELKNCVCNNDSYFYRSNEHFRTDLDDVEFSKDFNHIDYEGIVQEDQYYMNGQHNYNLEYDYDRNFVEESEKYPTENDSDSIYEYDIKNNKNHEWGNKQR